ncbi:hypothetical protein [Aliivibrio fischeri]|uniref:hypothetical protein n=1 Tax=Aliivibrio fischeri TaxID=668 RepID=UPI00084BD461|nr:hypothetical protein [Aliivibrio fischeri]OED53388.1 hypothetical protein BEI47_05780 [Aliivibrio fischeri]
MIKIKNIKCIIEVQGSIQDYGFEHSFSDKVNIISGDNSSGKSTILSCIYYCLGMEQLLGGNKADILDKCLRLQFNYNNTDHKVTYSKSVLTIENNNGSIAKIKRVIKGRQQENKNEIVVKIIENETNYTKTLYARSVGDHDNDNGFYNWLMNFSSLKLPEIHQVDGKRIKSLYLQNIMSCALVEQTKGWSDFFSQMPYFGIKDSKTKVIEFLLGLSSLENDIKKDLLEQEKNELKNNWIEKVNNFNIVMSRYSLQLDNIPEKYTPKTTVASITKANLYQIDNDELHPIKDIISSLKISLLNIEKNNSNPVEKHSEQGLLIESIRKLNKQLRTLENQKLTEQLKLKDYTNLLLKTKKDIEKISGIKKVKVINDLSIITNCPACDSSLSEESRLELKTNQLDYEKSLAFLKSQEELYKIYIKNISPLLEKFNNAISFYKEELISKQLELNEIKKDISDETNISRNDIIKEIKIKSDIEKFTSANEYLKIFIESMSELCTKIKRIEKDIDSLELGFNEDDIKIDRFQETFRDYLFNFEYSSNLEENIKIDREPPSKLLPLIEINVFKGSPDRQPIRLSSSASDFIRSEWAFYFSLLKISSFHPGFIIFDEPGQHAMKISSMKNLISSSISLNKQVILAISKDSNRNKKTEEKDIVNNDNINKILVDLDVSKINIIDIDPENKYKCIKPI